MSHEMHVISARYAAHAHELWAAAEAAYQTGVSEAAYWMLVDLRRSAHYREVAGSAFAYARAETFAGIFAEMVQHCENVSIFKELGDGLLIKSGSWRPLMEILCLADSIRRSWPATDERLRAPSFDFSAAIHSGECTRIDRREGSPDYLGSAIDRVARMSGFRDIKDTALLAVVEENSARELRRSLTDEYPFLRLGRSELLGSGLQKAEEEPIRICRLRIDRARFDGFREYFARFR
jgi:class 3 adenylate cyclase